MGLMLSVLIECVGVLEVIACYQHLSYGIQHALDEPKPELSKIKQNLRKELIDSDKHISLNEITRDVKTSEDVTSQCYMNENETHSCLIIEENKNLVTDENVYESVNDTITDPLHCLIFDSSNIESKLCSPELKNDSDYLQSDQIESKLLNESVHETTLNTNERELIDEYVNTQVTFNEDENSSLDKIVIEKDLNKFLQTPAVVNIKEHQHIEQNEGTSKTAAETETNNDIYKKNTLEQQNEHTQAGDEVTDNIREHLESDKIFDTELSDKISLHENIEILVDNNTILNQTTLISPGNYVEQISDVPSSNLVRVSENEIPLGNVISGPFESIEEVAILREVEALTAQETRSSETLEGIESIPIAEEILNNEQEEAVRPVNDEENVNERESASAVPVNGQIRVVNGIGELRGHFQVVPEPDTSQSDPNDQAEYVVDVVLSQAEEDHHDHNDVGSISNDFGVVVYDLPVFRNAGARIVPSEYSEDQTTDEISELSIFTETDLTNSGPEMGMMPTTLYYHPESGSLIEIIHENYDDVASDVYSYDINPENVEIDERMSHSCLYNPDSVFYRPPSPFPDVEISLTRNELKIPESLYETDSNKSMDEELADKPKGKRVSFQDYVQTEEYEKDSLEDEPMIENQNVETILGQLNVEEIENEDSVNLSAENQKLLDDDSAQAVSVLTKTDEIIAALKEMTSPKILEDGSKKETYTETEEFAEADYVFERETSPLYVEPYVLENTEESIKGRNQQLSYDFLTQASEDIIFDVVNANKNEQKQTIVSTVSEPQLNSVIETDAGNISLTPHKNEEERSKSPTSRINIQQSQTHNLTDELHTNSNQITLSSMNAVSLESQLSRGDSEVEFNTDTIVQTSINIQNKQLDECIISEESGEIQTETAIEKIETSTSNTMSEFIPQTQSHHLLEGKKVIQEATCVQPLNKKEESNKYEETTTTQIQFDSKTNQLGDVIKSETIIGNVTPEINDEIIDENVHFVENIIQSSREGIIKRYKQDQNNEIKRFDSEPILPQREDDLDDTTPYNTDFLNSLDGIKMNNLARDSGSWRRKNFRNRRSLSSTSSKSSSKASRDEELKMLTSLEESEQGITYETMKQNIGTDNIPEPETSAISEEKTTPHRRRRKHRSGKGGKQTEKNNFTQSVHSVLQDVTEIECGQSVTPNIDIINEEIMINDNNIEVIEANISDLSSKISEDALASSSGTLNDDETLERIEIEQAHASYEQKNQMKTLYKIASFEDASEGQHQEILPKRLSSKKDDDVSNNKTAEVPTTSAFSPRGDNTRNENNSDVDNATVSTSEERSNRSSSQAFWVNNL